MKVRQIALLIFLLVPLSVLSVNTVVEKGDRPVIDYSSINEDAYKKGVLIIKFSRDYEKHLEQNQITTDKNEIIRFGLKEVDKLNTEYGVRSARQHFKSGALKNEFNQRHKHWGFHLWYRIELDEKADIIQVLNKYQGLAEIEIAEPEFHKIIIGSQDDFYEVIKPKNPGQQALMANDPEFINQWHYHNTNENYGTAGADISLISAWELQKGSRDVIVAIIDTGIDHYHEDIQENMWPGIGYNFIMDSPTIARGDHGTHVAGTVAAVSNNNTGVAGIAGGSGQSDGVRLMSCQVFMGAANGDGFHLAHIYAADNGAAIAQNSWSYIYSNTYEQHVLDAIDYFNVHGGGTVMNGGLTFFAAGNLFNSFSPALKLYPAYYDGTVAVTATNHDDLRAWYSNFGYWIDIAAPGGEVHDDQAGGVISTLTNNRYGASIGTSMACPHVSGVAALILSSASSTPSPEDVLTILKNTTDNIYGLNPRFAGQLGSGRLNAHHAVLVAEDYHIRPDNPPAFNATTAGEYQIDLQWQQQENFPVLLAWSPDYKFGLPRQGVTYQTGDSLEGGGYIIYSGNATEFQHMVPDPGTIYYYKLFSVEGGNNYSAGLSSHAYSQCGAVPLPVFETFDDLTPPYCWEHTDNTGTLSSWRISKNQGNPPPAMIFSFGPHITGYSSHFTSMLIDGHTSANGIALEFDLALRAPVHFNTLEELVVQINNGSGWVELKRFDNSKGNISMDTHYFDISPFAKDHYFNIRFLGRGQDSENIHFWVIDNFKVFPIPCPQPFNLAGEDITPNSIVLHWESTIDNISYDINFGEPGFDPDSEGTLISDIQNTTYMLDNLVKFTPYQAYIRTSCDQSAQSVWTGPLSFTTLATCPAPVDFFVTGISTYSAELTWLPGGQESVWQIEWGPEGFTRGENGVLVDSINEPFFLLSDLEIVTTYDVYLRALCGTDDESVWVNAQFTTDCGVFPLPFSEGFDGNSVSCWSFPQGEGNWRFGNHFPPPSSTSGMPHATFHWSPVRQNYSFSMESPVFYATIPDEPVKLGFVLLLNNFSNSTTESMLLEYKGTDDNEWIAAEIFSNHGLNNEVREHVRKGVYLPGMEGRMFQVRFRAEGFNSTAILGWSLDDISVYQGDEDCPEPLALLADSISYDSATLTWESEGFENTWDILWGPEGFDPQTQGTLVEGVSQNPWTLQELQPLTHYEFYVKAVCNVLEQSQWSGPSGFSTTEPPFFITVTTEGPGSAEPSGNVPVQAGNDLDMELSAHEGAHIAEVLLDGESVMDQIITQRDNGHHAWGQLFLENIMADHDIHVNFAMNVYELTLSAQPLDAGTVSGEGTYEHFSQVEIKAIPSEGFIFVNWTEGQQVVSEDRIHMVEILGPLNLVANFQIATSSGELNELTEVKIYPNPVNSRLWVELPGSEKSDVEITLFSIHGREVKKAIIYSGQTSTSLIVSDLLPGMYFISINDLNINKSIIIY